MFTFYEGYFCTIVFSNYNIPPLAGTRDQSFCSVPVCDRNVNLLQGWDFRCISQRFFDISLFVFSVIQLFGNSGEWIAWKRHEFHVILRLAF